MKTHTLSAAAALAPLLAQPARAAYSVMAENFTPSTFFSRFNFNTATDPTGGFVQYISEASAAAQGIVSSGSDSVPVYIGVDHSNVASSGRQSVRMESINTFERGLFILDASHMPEGCGVWPAFWALGPNWPNNGEIDIIEGVNLNTYNNIALHTSSGCSVSGSGGTGVTQTTVCDSPGADDSNTGCSVHDNDATAFGSGFNAIGGGVYAMEWNSDFIKVWFFPRSSIPSDALGSNPEPANWGTPRAQFQGSCDINSHFNSMQLVFNIDFCGSWAGSVWGSSGCQNLAGSCNDYVANNPSAFANAYWIINSLKVFSS